jgi:hypothetical protein
MSEVYMSLDLTREEANGLYRFLQSETDGDPAQYSDPTSLLVLIQIAKKMLAKQAEIKARGN